MGNRVGDNKCNLRYPVGCSSLLVLKSELLWVTVCVGGFSEGEQQAEKEEKSQERYWRWSPHIMQKKVTFSQSSFTDGAGFDGGVWRKIYISHHGASGNKDDWWIWIDLYSSCWQYWVCWVRQSKHNSSYAFPLLLTLPPKKKLPVILFQAWEGKTLKQSSWEVLKKQGWQRRQPLALLIWNTAN